MMPLRDMTLLCADQHARDAVGLFGPGAPAKAEHARELAAVENRIRRPARRRREFAGGNWNHARRAPRERRLGGNDAPGEAMPCRHAAAGIMIRTPHIVAGCETRSDSEDRRGEISGRGWASVLVRYDTQFVA